MIYGVLVFVAVCFATTSALPPCICTRDYTPVCGSDGETYGNECMLNCAKAAKSDLTLDKLGSCSEEQKLCICTLEYKPVCGSDGTTYSNKCVMGCEPTVRLAYEGQCDDAVEVAEIPECSCSREKKEICGSDGNTYANPCLLNCATAKNPSLSILNSGPCNNEVKVVEQPEHVKVAEIPNCICTREKKQVCGSDGNTYDNPCLLNCAAAFHSSLSIASSGPCNNEVKVVEEPAAGPVCACTRDMRPVCGSDGITYGNPCMFNCASKRNPSLTLARRGPCSPSNHAQCACTRELNPVCASDGQTYTSTCIMKCRNKEAEVVHDGPCDE